MVTLVSRSSTGEMNTMTPSTEAFILQTIAHYYDILAGKGKPSARTCPLCSKFNLYKSMDCITTTGEKCPIYLKTGNNYCSFTPFQSCYDVWYKHQHDSSPIQYNEVEKAVIQTEIDFLKSLLP